MRESFSTVLSLLRWIATAVVTAFWGTLSLLLSVFDGSGRSAHFCMHHWSRWCLRIGSMRLQVRGLENALTSDRFIIVSNHQGQIDILILSAIFRRPFLWVSKKEIFRVPFLGWHMKRAGYVEVDRSNHERAVQSMTIAAERLRAGKSIAFFPEGTRSRTGILQPFKSGAFHLAIETETPILPVAIDGSIHALAKGTFRVHPTEIRVTVLPPVETRGMHLDQRHPLRDEVRNVIGQVLEKGAL